MISLKYNITLDIATASTRRAAKWQNKRVTWQDIVNTLSQTERTPETLKQYFSYTKDRQCEIKDVGGLDTSGKGGVKKGTWNTFKRLAWMSILVL